MAIKFLRVVWDRENSGVDAVFDAGTYRDRPLGEMHMSDGEVGKWLADPAKYQMSEADCAELETGLQAIKAAVKAEIWKHEPSSSDDLDEIDGEDVERDDDSLA